MSETRGEYGEPWRVEVFGMGTRDVPFSHYIFGGDGYRIGPKQLERAVTCANALSGIRNPAAVQELVEACRELLDGRGLDQKWLVGEKRLAAALAALDREPEVGT